MRRTISATTGAVQKRIFYGLLVLLLVLFGLYGYFVSKSITNVLLREETEQDILAVNSDISELEFKYLDQKNMINLDLAYEWGFSDISDKTFVTRASVFTERLTVSNEI